MSEDRDRPTVSDTSDASDSAQEELDAKLLADLKSGDWLHEQDFPPLRYAVDGLLPEGFSLLIGPPKAGKSWLVLDLLLAISGGRRAVGKIPMGLPRRVLYLALEDGDRRMQDRCRKLLGDTPIPSRFHYLTQVQPNFVLSTIGAFLRRFPDTALVVVDTLGKVMPPSQPGESAYQRDYRVAGALKRAADAHKGLAVTAIHHDRKAASEDFIDSVSGTHGLAGAADTIIVLARKRQSQEAVLKVTGRDVPEAEYAMVMHEGTWVLDGASLAEAAENARNREEAGNLGDTSVSILQFVRQHPQGVRAADVREKFGDNADQYLKRLADDGRITKLRRGIYAPAPQLPLCAGCGGPFEQLTPDQTTHPGCEAA
ncbi:AAA family ATPase [Streptomyces griseosporeus]|uniref:AAA family ATPase n=1 Tax=Streptomyces griseosporeus TaxID=1910 RepID=UPI0036F60254